MSPGFSIASPLGKIFVNTVSTFFLLPLVDQRNHAAGFPNRRINTRNQQINSFEWDGWRVGRTEETSIAAVWIYASAETVKLHLETRLFHCDINAVSMLYFNQLSQGLQVENADLNTQKNKANTPIRTLGYLYLLLFFVLVYTVDVVISFGYKQKNSCQQSVADLTVSNKVGNKTSWFCIDGLGQCSPTACQPSDNGWKFRATCIL